RVVGLMTGRTPVWIHVVHGSAPVLRDVMDGFDEPPRGGADASGRGSHGTGVRSRDADRARGVLCGSAAERLVVLLGAAGSTGPVAQRRTPRRVGPVCQDPPRRSISTNTLRMMGPRYDARPPAAVENPESFTM